MKAGLSPLRGLSLFSICPPTAYAVGCILTPLRGYIPTALCGYILRRFAATLLRHFAAGFLSELPAQAGLRR